MEARTIAPPRRTAIRWMIFSVLIPLAFLLIGVVFFGLFVSTDEPGALLAGIVFVALSVVWIPTSIASFRIWRAEGLTILGALRLSAEGLEQRALTMRKFIPWPEVEAVRVFDTFVGEGVEVRAKSPMHVTVRGLWDLKSWRPRKKPLKKNILSILTSAYKLPTWELANEIAQTAGLLAGPALAESWLEEKPWRRLARSGARVVNGAILALTALVWWYLIDYWGNEIVSAILGVWLGFGALTALNLVTLWAVPGPVSSFMRSSLVGFALVINVLILLILGIVFLSELGGSLVIQFTSGLWIAGQILSMAALFRWSRGTWVERGSAPEPGTEGA